MYESSINKDVYNITEFVLYLEIRDIEKLHNYHNWITTYGLQINYDDCLILPASILHEEGCMAFQFTQNYYMGCIMCLQNVNLIKVVFQFIITFVPFFT